MSQTSIFKTVATLSAELQKFRYPSKSIGFVPTMGALHDGHIALIKQAASENNILVVSIFVNPTQFNDKKDLDNYPRMLEQDTELLRGLPFECIIFAPDQKEVYPENDLFDVPDFKNLDKVLEGKFRPGHFQGVAHVVHNLLKIVQPDRAYFGRKDLQQLAVIRAMSLHYKLPLGIIACDTKREAKGLAMSSRNIRLSKEQKEDSLIIFQTLQKVKEWRKRLSPLEVRTKAIDYFNKGTLNLEYLELVDERTFELLSDEWSNNSACCIAAYCGEVRLIDNMAV
jgi:pantoate--beta-alanine ligase